MVISESETLPVADVTRVPLADATSRIDVASLDDLSLLCTLAARSASSPCAHLVAVAQIGL
jgi:hypothetical protein